MIDIEKLEALAKAAIARGDEIGEESWYSTEEFVCNMLMHPDDAMFAEATAPAAILALIAEVRNLRAKLQTPIAMKIKWSPLETTMLDGWSDEVAEDALKRGKRVMAYYGEARSYVAHAKEQA